MSISPPRSGYTLPVFACASAIASLQHLHGENELNSVTFNLLEPPETVTIAKEPWPTSQNYPMILSTI